MTAMIADQVELSAELARALASHARRQRDHAAILRNRAGAVRASAESGCDRHPGAHMANWRRQLWAGAEAQAADWERQAERCELRANHADQGRLLHGAGENSDPFYLSQQGGYGLVRMARPAGIVICDDPWAPHEPPKGTHGSERIH